MGSRPTTRTLLVVATRERTRGRAVLELAEPASPDTRFTLWPGLPPPTCPLHPSLAPRILSGRVQGEAVWLEARPCGVPLDRLAASLAPPQVALVLQDCCEGLQALHDAGRVHGDVKSKRVVVGVGGYATLVGVGQRPGHPEEDLAALIRLGRTLTREHGSLPLPEVAPASPGALAEVLAERLAAEDEAALREVLSTLSAREVARIPEEPTEVRIAVEHEDDARGRMDELAVGYGPDTEHTGSQPSWSGHGEDVTREAQPEATLEVGAVRPEAGDEEGTGSLPPVGDSQAARVQVLARVLAPLRHPAPPARFRHSEGQPCEAIRERLVAGPPDPLPFPGELPEQLHVEEQAAGPSRDVSITRVFRERSTQVGAAPGVAPRRRLARLLLGLSLLLVVFLGGMLVGSALLHLLWGAR